MKFLGLKIFIAILELIAFLLITPCLIVIGWALFGGQHPLSGQSLAQTAIVIGVVYGVLFMGIVIAAIASLLNLLLAIERNTAAAAENTARVVETEPKQLNWRLAGAIGAILVGVLLLVVVFVVAFSSGQRRTTERIKELSGDGPVAAQSSGDLYSSEKVAEYCKTHPTGFYGAVGSASGVSCPDWERKNQSKPAAAQNSRDDWKLPSFNLEAHLDHTLANAPFTSAERAQILRVIEDFAISEKQKEEPETLMTSRVGSIGLAEDGSQQILVQGPYAAFCGASGNCPMWIFTTSRSGQLTLALQMFGDALNLRATSNAGYRDLAASSHFSAYEEYFSVYRWNGNKYDSVDCYKATYDSDRSIPLVITDCQPRS
jgi:hypothetical protein